MGSMRLCRGDIFAGNPEAIAHGCNLLGVMGAGIAVEFKNRYPLMFDEYQKACKEKKLRGGDVFVYDAPGTKIFNLMTQSGCKGADIQFLREALDHMCEQAMRMGIRRVTIPMIGAGLGGIQPTVCLNCYLEAVEKYNIELYVVVQVVPGMKPCPMMDEKHDPADQFKRAREIALKNAARAEIAGIPEPPTEAASVVVDLDKK